MCAEQSIDVSATGHIHGAKGAPGGEAVAEAVDGAAYAVAGDAGKFGNVLLMFIEPSLEGPKITLTAGGSIAVNEDPNPWVVGGASSSTAGSVGSDAGRDSLARAGAGAKGGVIELTGTVQDQFVPQASPAGKGGQAQAQASDGAKGLDGTELGGGSTLGKIGGNALATGGNGGKPSPKTVYYDAAGNKKFTAAGGPGHGGDALSRAGTGGTGGNITSGKDDVGCRRGGSSGTAEAAGGADGDGLKNPPKQIVAQPPTRDKFTTPCVGGVGGTARSAGR